MILTGFYCFFTGFYWVLLGFTGFHVVFNGFYWVLQVFTGFYVDFNGFYWVLLGFTGFYRVSLGFTGFYWVLLRFSASYSVLLGFGVFLPVGVDFWGRIFRGFVPFFFYDSRNGLLLLAYLRLEKRGVEIFYIFF